MMKKRSRKEAAHSLPIGRNDRHNGNHSVDETGELENILQHILADNWRTHSWQIIRIWKVISEIFSLHEICIEGGMSTVEKHVEKQEHNHNMEETNNPLHVYLCGNLMRHLWKETKTDLYAIELVAMVRHLMAK
jgi:hypothetical protein